ncbi:iron chelate uptake ABC transporter family permease subunit [Actinospica sp. MGRD01-02]|uniref:Iron chelate uptake ABC transporter family permease subunit n=1 Tax=Actinospica acidithermotolerans TaxID=2828514 RepID=A0A941EDK0_9ACTN|nr:iron chelate uptake ABC transporter family permease subunit [Actinospica acidithermotolerans]MBR7829546.1 iron chelate uptake ABC transporter family permease subunit [Actinospica acidithermotolerans]
MKRSVGVSVVFVALAAVAAFATVDIGQFSGGITEADAFIINQLLLPRILTAVLAGASLALAGAVFQSVTRNPLGSPDVLGFTQGAATGALVGIMAFGGGALVVAVSAWIGAVGSGVTIYLVARRGGVTGGARLILVGIGIAAILSAVNEYLITRANIVDAAAATVWITGSLDGSTWSGVVILAAVTFLLAPCLLLTSRSLRVLELGDDLAIGLGLGVEKVRLLTLTGAVLLAATAASQTGPVAFLALCAPHLARRLTRRTGPNLVPTLLLGAALMLWADYISQHAIPNRVLPAGVVTGVLGGGYLVYLLAHQRKTGQI